MASSSSVYNQLFPLFGAAYKVRAGINTSEHMREWEAKFWDVYERCKTDYPSATTVAVGKIRERYKKKQAHGTVYDTFPELFGAASTSLNTKAWRKAKFVAYIVNGSFCACCGSTASENIPLSVDHIKPKSKWPNLKYDIRNLQILCEPCNVSKGDWSTKDFRNDSQKLRAMTAHHFPETISDM